MPQMAPLNWLMMFIMFTMFLLIFSSMIFYNFNYKPLSKNFLKLNKTINWKW